MKITFYQGCLVNKNYDEVFRYKDLINEYLENHIVYSTEIENTYTPLNGRLTIENINNFNLFNCNYITFDENGIYAFINDINVVNGLIVVDYECDYWHTFIDKLVLRESLLTRSSYVDNSIFDFYELPINYQNIDGYVVESVKSTNNRVFLVVEIQYYNLSSGGETSNVNTAYCYLSGHEVSSVEVTDTGEIRELLSPNINTLLNTLTVNQSTNKLTLINGENTVNYYYKILNAYVVPYIYKNILFEYKTTDENTYTVPRFKIDIGQPYIYLNTLIYKNDYGNTTNPSYYTSLAPNPFIKSIGFATQQFPYIFNGKTQTFYIHAVNDRYNFYIYLNSPYGLMEITDIFKLDLNFDVADGEVLAQQEIARKTENLKGISGIATNTLTTVANVAGVVGGVMSYNPALVLSSGVGLVNSANNLLGSINQIENAEKAKFNNSTVTNSNLSGLLNAVYGLCFQYFDKYSADNFLLVEQCINEAGYKVYKFTNSIDVSANIINYNFIKFDFVRLSCCSDKIASIFRMILTNGVKIWYNSTGTE